MLFLFSFARRRSTVSLAYFTTSLDENTPSLDSRRSAKERKKKGGSNAAGDGSSGAAGAEDQHAKLTSMDHTVYVEGIPFDCSEDDVKQFFVSNGVEDVIQMRLSK